MAAMCQVVWISVPNASSCMFSVWEEVASSPGSVFKASVKKKRGPGTVRLGKKHVGTSHDPARLTLHPMPAHVYRC